MIIIIPKRFVLFFVFASSRDTFGSVKIGLFRQFGVQEFSADTKLHELTMQRGKPGRL